MDQTHISAPVLLKQKRLDMNFSFFLILTTIILQCLQFSCISAIGRTCIIAKNYQGKAITPNSIAIVPVTFEDSTLNRYQDRIAQEVRIALMRNCSSIFTFRNVVIPEETLIGKDVDYRPQKKDDIKKPHNENISFMRYQPKKGITLKRYHPENIKIPKTKGLSFNGYIPEVIVFINNISFGVYPEYVTSSLPMGPFSKEGFFTIRTGSWYIGCGIQYVFWHNIDGRIICYGKASHSEKLFSKNASEEEYTGVFSTLFEGIVQKTPLKNNLLDKIDF